MSLKLNAYQTNNFKHPFFNRSFSALQRGLEYHVPFLGHGHKLVFFIQKGSTVIFLVNNMNINHKLYQILAILKFYFF